MIFNTTYNDQEVTSQIDSLVGESFSWFDRLKKGGIGSEKMMIVDASPLIEGLLQYDNEPNYCNVELRPKGIILHFKFRAELYGWVIPFGKLSVNSQAEFYKIFGDAEFVKVTKMMNSEALKKFIQKLMLVRADYLESIAGPDGF